MKGASGRYVEVLQVDDDPDDVFFLAEGLKQVDAPIRVTVAGDVDAALTLLLDPVTSRPPDLILLDIRLPGRSGFELLAHIRGSGEPLACLPVIILSTSNSPDDIRQAYCGFANAYVQKPQDMEGYGKLAHCLSSFWLQAASLAHR